MSAQPVPQADWGALVINTDVDEALLEALREWLPTYLPRIAVERERPPLELPNSYANVLEQDEFMDNQLPAILVTTASTAKVKGGPNTRYEAEWQVRVSSVVRGRKPSETRHISALYEGSVRRVMIQKARKSPIVCDVDWAGTQLAPVLEMGGRGRYLAAGIGTYNVQTDFALQGAGPNVPAAAEYLPLAKVADVTFQAESK
jgi:hypothetical protein